jgi:sugar phosphate isomerase/epimerase
VRDQVAAARGHWRALAAIAGGAGIRFVLELHDRTITTGASGALRLLDGLDPAQVGVILDVGNAAMEGNEPLTLALELLGPYLAHVHVKDVSIRAGGTGWNGCETAIVPLGQGAIRWAECLRLLRAAGYAGWLAIENFTGLDQGPARLADDAAWLRARLAEARA